MYMMICMNIFSYILHMDNKCRLVKQTCQWVCDNSTHVSLLEHKLAQLAAKFSYTPFNHYDHHQVSEDPAHSLLYLFMLHSLNFCFWPLPGFEYEHLAASVKQYVLRFHS